MKSGIFVPVSFILLKETYAPVLLERKTRRLRKQTGNPNLYSKITGQISPRENFKRAIVRPFKLLLITPIVTLNAIYIAIIYATLYLLISTFTFVYQEQYGFDEGSSGLTFIPSGVGLFTGVIGFGQITDFIVKRNQAKGFSHKPEVRLSPLVTIPSGLALPTGLFIYGWTTDKGVHWIVPMLGVLIFSTGLMGVNVCCSNQHSR